MPHPTLVKLARSREKLLHVAAGLSESQLDRHSGDGWTIRQILTHLLNAEEDHVNVITVIANNEAHRLPAEVILDEYNARRLDERGHLTLAQLIEALTRQRRQTEALFDTLSEDQLARRGRHPVLGEMSAGDIFRILSIHEQQHTREIEATLAT